MLQSHKNNFNFKKAENPCAIKLLGVYEGCTSLFYLLSRKSNKIIEITKNYKMQEHTDLLKSTPLRQACFLLVVKNGSTVVAVSQAGQRIKREALERAPKKRLKRINIPCIRSNSKIKVDT